MKQQTLVLLTALVAAVAGAQAEEDSYFEANELGLLVYGSWVDKVDSDVAFGGSVTYFLSRHVGLGAGTRLDNYDGTFIDNVLGELYLRLPLAELPLAPYAVGTVGYSFETEEAFCSAGAGAELRFNAKWGVFGDVQWQINDDTDDGIGIRLGVHVNF
ncbi:MAG TPA: hypothetical protein PKM73_00885 [Verrucomicrobiota bacterium]|nr:hypothetical protein [Verrucomicrobiota bacterium]HNU49898.1 hypothetical protein [Verrucomicrobiota bacterium]